MKNALESLDELLAFGFIQPDEYKRRRMEIESTSQSSMSSESYGSCDDGMDLDLGASEQSRLRSGDRYVAASHYEKLNGPVVYDSKPSDVTVRNSLAACAKDEKVVRLFVSSTFKDMKEERDLLVKNVFPEIKRICRQRGLNFVYVDFRWGITNEESNGGKVLSLCLGEIDRCRPWFLGMLGERYGRSASASGGVPDTALKQSFEDAVNKGYEWLLPAYSDRSVTEIEMLYGALFYPEMAKNSFIYLRDPKYLEVIQRRDPIAKSRDFEPQTEQEKRRINDLKSRIAASGLSVKENYRDPVVFAEMALNDLKAAIEREYPLNKYAKKMGGLSDEAAVHRLFAEERASLYVGKKAYFAAIKRHILSRSTSPLIITGPYGSGKSSVVSKWLSKLTTDPDYQKRLLFPIINFIGLTTSYLSKMLLLLMHEIKTRWNIDKDIPKDAEEIVHCFSEWLAIASTYGGLILVLDGLENLEDKHQNLSWLPQVLPKNIQIIVSCREDTKPFLSLRKRGYCDDFNFVVRLDGLNNQEKRKLIERYLAQYSKKLGHEQIYYLVEDKQTSNPLYLRAILEQLRVCGEFDHLTDFILSLLRAGSLDRLFEMCLKQWEKDYTNEESPEFVKTVMSLLYCSNSGLLESELAAILNVSQQTMWSSFLDATREALLNQGGLLSIVNTHLKEAVKRLYIIDSRTETKYRTMISSFFQGKAITSGAGPQRKLTEYPYQLMKTDNKEQMLRFLSDIEVFFQLYNDLSKYDLFAYWRTVGFVANPVDILSKAFERYRVNNPDEKYQSEVLFKLGNFMKEIGKAADATPLFEQALSIKKKIYGEQSEECAKMMRDFALLREQQARFEEAFSLATRSREIREKLFGKENPKTADSIWLQGLLSKKMGDFPKALLLFNDALRIAEKHHGKTHPTVALYLKTIADVYRNLAEFDQAEKIYARALEINQSFFGDLHPECAEVLECLGRVAKKKGNYEAAKPYYERALESMEKIYGTDHLKIAEIYQHLADVYRKLGNIKDAESLYRKALDINTKQLGEDHPVVGETLNQLATIFKVSGNYDDAITYASKAITIGEKAFGKDHVKVAAFLNSLADIYSITGKYDLATKLYLRALSINESKLGYNHPECSENLNALGMISKKRGRYKEAENYYERALKIIEAVYGADHPKVALYVHNLGVIYRKHKQHKRALAAFERAKTINCKVFGENHPLVAGNLVGIGLAIKKDEGDLDDASSNIERAIEIFQENFGEEHEKVAWALNYLAEIHRKQGKYGVDGAEKLYLRALAINKKCFGEWSDHPEIAENLNGLAQVYTNQTNFYKAEPLYKQALEMSETTLGRNHPHVINRYRNLANMYQSQGKVSHAETIWAKIEELKAMPPIEGE